MKIIKPDFENSIMNVSNSFLKHYNIKTNYPGIKELDDLLVNNFDHIIYILLDGMGINVIKEHLSKEDALRKHVTKEITSVFPPTTVAATNSVLSGLPPISTGYLGWVQYFKDEDTDMAVFLNKDFYTNKEYDLVFRDKYLAYENIVSQIHRHNPTIITNQFFPGFIDGSDTKSFKDEIDKVLLVTHNTDQSFNYLYWTQPDLTEHEFGTKSQEVKTVVQDINKDFEELLKNLPDNTLVTVIADHGLVDVEEINLFDYSTLVNMLTRKPSIEPRAINFFVKEEFIHQFKDEFNKNFQGKYVLLSKEEIYKSNTFGEGQKHKLIDMFIGDYLGIAVDKYMFTLSGEKKYKAHHAGLTEDEMMVPLIIYTKNTL